jgi:CheY-like chemotaxis protein
MIRPASTTKPNRWLVVDDNPDVGEVIELALRELAPARIDRFSCAFEALAAVASNPEGVELLITDRDMPGMCGGELSWRIRACAPRVKIILATANDQEFTPEELRLAGISAVLAKPFSLESVAAIIRTARRVSTPCGNVWAA